MARPTKFNDKLAKRILEIYSSGKNLLQVEKEKGLPSRRTVLRWRKDYPEFGKDYQDAIQAHTDYLIEQAQRIADTESDSKKAKNMIEIRMWRASKLNRSQYGDKLDVQHNVNVDISPALSSAIDKMRSLGTGQAPLIEAECVAK